MVLKSHKLQDHDVIIMKGTSAQGKKKEAEESSGETTKVHHHNHARVQLKHAFAGGLSGALTRAISQPFDVLKIRFQLQVEPVSSNQVSKYKSMTQAIRLMIKEEGRIGLWKGHNPAQILSVIYGVSQFWCYEELISHAHKHPISLKHPAVTNFVCGGISGAVATFFASPLDVVRTRLIAQDFSNGYKNSYQGVKQILRRDGVTGLYRGMIPSLFQVVPLTGMNFMLYKFVCGLWTKTMRLSSEREIPGLGLVFIGGLTGVTSKTILYPMDLSKKRLQIQGFDDHRKTFGTFFKCSGLLHCMRQTIQKEGFFGLYKGLYPSMWKAGVTTAFHFAFYEEICRLIIEEGE